MTLPDTCGVHSTDAEGVTAASEWSWLGSAGPAGAEAHEEGADFADC